MKSIQQILEEDRAKSRLGQVTEGHISHVLTNKNRTGDKEFSKNCQDAQQKVWDDPNKSKIKRQVLNDIWTNNPDKLVKPRLKKIQVPWGLYESRTLAEEQGALLGIKRVAHIIREGLINDTTNFFYLEKEKKTMPLEARLRMAENKKKNGSIQCLKFETPFGIFNTKRETLEVMKLNKVPNPRHTLTKLLADPNSGYKQI